MTKHVLILATDGFEQSELMEPKANLEQEGFKTTVASLEDGEIKGWKDGDWGESVNVDITLDGVDVSKFDGLLLPGGQMNPDVLRMKDDAIQIVKDFAAADKPIAAICHAPWLLIEAGLVDGKTITGWPSIRTDLSNAGGNVVDQEAAVDGKIVTSRNPDDIPAFSKAFIELVQKQPTLETA